jgi:hypothetical protein
MIRLGAPRGTGEWTAALIGAILAVSAVTPLVRGAASLSWPKVTGIITYSSPDSSHYRTVRVDIRYSYRAGGEERTGNRYKFQFAIPRDRMRTRDVMLAQARFPVGEIVDVAVNPRDPADSVLLPDPTSKRSDGWPSVCCYCWFARAGRASSRRPPPWTPGPRRATARILALIGVAVLLFGLRDLYDGWSSPGWPTADGRILFSQAATATGPIETLLRYEYRVSGRRYVSEKYRTGGNRTPFRAVAKAAARRYPAGRSVKVYYNPLDPADSLLEPGVWFGNFVLPSISVAVLALALLVHKAAPLTRQLP